MDKTIGMSREFQGKETLKKLATMEVDALRKKYRRNRVLASHEKIEKCIRSLVHVDQAEVIRKMLVLYMGMDGAFAVDGLIKMLMGRIEMLQAGTDDSDPVTWDNADLYEFRKIS